MAGQKERITVSTRWGGASAEGRGAIVALVFIALIVAAAWVISGKKPGGCQTNAAAGLEPAPSSPNLWNCDVPRL